MTCGAAETYDVPCCRNLSRCGAVETYHGAVLPKLITCDAVETYHGAVLPERTRFIPEGGIYMCTFLSTERLVPGDRHNHI